MNQSLICEFWAWRIMFDSDSGLFFGERNGIRVHGRTVGMLKAIINRREWAEPGAMY